MHQPTTIESQNSLKLTILRFIIVLFGAVYSSSSTMSPERDAYRQVKTNLLSHPYAVDKVPPKVGVTDDIQVLLSFVPQQVLFINEVEMTVTISATLLVSWHEPAFAWDPTNSSVYMVTVSKHDVWSPVLMNTLSIKSDDLIIELTHELRVEYTGNVRTVHMPILTVSCSFDMEWFPFDQQRCAFPMVPFNAESANVHTVSTSGPLISVGFENDTISDWTWEEVNPRQTSFNVDAGQGIMKKISFVSFEVLMKRRSTIFYLTNVIFPMAATAILTLGVFFIPAESGEKISYLISIFISTTVFLSSLSNTMSKGQGNICRFNAFIVAITVQIILATAASMFVLHRHKQEQEQKQEKDGGVTSVPSFRNKNDNTINLANKIPDHRRRSSFTGADDDNNHLAKPIAPKIMSDPQIDIPYVKTDAFERTISTRKYYGEELMCKKRLTLNTLMSGTRLSSIRRLWTRGCRMTSTELDQMFFVLFVVTTIITVIIIVHAK